MSERLLLELEGGGRPPAELPRSGTLVLGRSKERAGFQIEAEGVADLHAAIGRAKSGGWAIRDLGSDAGTKVNGRKIEAARLRAGDRIEIGSARLRVVDPSNPATPASPGPRGDTSAVELVDTPPRGMAPAQDPPAPVASSLPPLPGYRLEKRIGRGGMGEVYLALQERLARQVAIKVLAPKLAADALFVQRFEAEARAAAALNHPNVVTVYDVGVAEGVHYLSMEFMDRGTLEERVQREGRLAWDVVLGILRDAASGLAYAESRGIVHRDLKPANLMQNHAGATKIADLGLATHVETEERASADQKVFGTAHFMAPEQARGEKVDQRCDLYALGATAYRLLTAHTPYEGATSRDILRALLREDPRPIATFAPDVPPQLVEIVAKLMRKDLAQRTPSANVLLKELEGLRSASAASKAGVPELAARKPQGMLVGLVLLAAAVAAWFALRGDGTKQQDPSGLAHLAPTPGPAPEQPKPVPPPVEPGPAPTPSDAAPVAPTKPPRESDERELELFETKARVALLEITSRQMEPAERILALREMAQKFNGTSSASDALEKSNALEQELANAGEAANARYAALLSLSEKLRAAAQLDAVPPSPGSSILAMRAVPGQEAFASDAVFQAEFTRIVQELFSKAAEYAKTVLEDTQKDLDNKDQAAAKTKLTALLPVFDVPEFPLGQAPPGQDVLFELGRRARERLANLGLIADQIQTQQSREETLALAQALSGPETLERELATLDLAAAKGRVATLTAKAGTPSTKLLLSNLQAELDGAQRAFALLAREYQGGWRRKGVDDPRDKSEAFRNVVAADAQGLMLEAAGGAERVPWTAFGKNSKALTHLFSERLAREYSSDEARDVMAILHLTAVACALDQAGKMFQPGRKANFTAGNAADMLEGFSAAQAWASRAGGASPLLEQDQAAAQLLAKVLQDTTEGSWSVAVAGTERLLREYQGSLLVRMLSDGSEPGK